jgi:hypothetical protein
MEENGQTDFKVPFARKGSGSDIDSAFLMTICDRMEADEQRDVSKGI